MVGNNIKKYRIRNKISLRKLGEILNVSHTTISKYESGEIIPNSTILIQLAKVFNIKVADLFKNFEDTLVIKEIHYRKKSNLGKRNQEVIEDITKEELKKYLEVMDLFPEGRFEIIDLEKFRVEITDYEEIENKVMEIREKLNLGIDPISNLLEVIEELGLIVIFIDSVNGFDGKDGLVNERPFIVLANDKSGDRQRNSLAHELGHLLIKHDNLDVEKVANYFAGAFLIPKDSLLKDLGKKRSTLTLFELKKLKEKYKVSMQSIIYRAWQLNIISETEKTNLFKKFSILGYRKVEPIDIEIEKSNKFEQMLCEAVTEGYLSESKAAEYLNIKTIEFMERYMGSGIDSNN